MDFGEKCFEKFGIKPLKFLGAGTQGHAFLLDGDKTLKITMDKAEAIDAYRCIGKNIL